MNRTIKEFLADILESIKDLSEWTRHPSSPNKTYKEVWVGDMTTRAKEINSSLANTSSVADWIQAITKAICVDYPNETNVVFRGCAGPSSHCYFSMYIYATRADTLSNGAPQYTFGLWQQYAKTFYVFGYQNYVFSVKDVWNSSDQSSGTLPGARLPLMLKTVSATSAKFSVNADATYYKDVALTAPSGYELVGCIGATTAHNQAGYIGGMFKSATNTIRVSGKNNASSNWTDMTVTVYGLYALSNIW